jgi:hypothetical protein
MCDEMFDLRTADLRSNALCIAGRSRPQLPRPRVEFEAPQEDSMSDKFDRRDFLRVDRTSPPLISKRVRAQRVLSIEAVINVERAILWPDSDG